MIPTHILVPHFGPTLHRDEISQMLIAVIKKQQKRKEIKKRCPNELNCPPCEVAKGKNVISQSERKPERALRAKSGTPLCENLKWDAQEKVKVA